jgi:Transposase DDE domain
MVRTLRDVWRIHYAREGSGPPRWRAGAELPPVGERLQSPYDPEAHYSTKRQVEWSGYKMHVTEICDEDAAHLVTHVLTCPAMQPDMASTADIHERLAAKGLLPAEHFVDSAYVDAALLVGSRRDHGVSREGPVRAVPRRRTEAEQAYEQCHFTIDWGREQVTCPQGKTSVTWRAGRDEVGAPRITAVFSRTDCGVCAARALCTPAKAARRSVYFHPRPLLPPTPGIRGAECRAGADARARVEAAPPRARWHRRHAFAGRARIRHAAKSLHRAGENRAATGLHGCRDERLARGELADRNAARQDARDALRRPGNSRLNSPTVSRSCPSTRPAQGRSRHEWPAGVTAGVLGPGRGGSPGPRRAARGGSWPRWRGRCPRRPAPGRCARAGSRRSGARWPPR